MKNRLSMRIMLAIVLIVVLAIAAPAMADVKIVKGPSPIDGDTLNHPEDITIYNDKIALTFAVGSPNFWGMTNGSISDIAVMNGPEDFGVDIVNDIEFLVNSWTASGGSLIADVEIIKDTPEEGIIKVTSTWLGENKENALDVVSTYTLKKDSNVVELHTIVSNPGPDTYTDLRSGYSISGLAAYMFGPFGYDTPDVRARYIHVGNGVDDPFGDFVVSYLSDYAITVQMDDTEEYRGTTGYKDLHKHYDLAPGESKEFTGIIHVADAGHTTPFIAEMIEKKGLNSATVSGIVKTDEGKPYPNPVIVVEREGSYKGTYDGSQYLGSDELHTSMQTFVWHIGNADGSFSFDLPEGEYNIYAVAAGYTPSKAKEVKIVDGEDVSLNFEGDYSIIQGGTVQITVTDKATGSPIDARIQVEGPVPAVKYLGARTFFTDLEDIGKVNIDLATGDFTFTIMSGANYFSLPEVVNKTVKSKQIENIEVSIETKIDPRAENWYSVDLHHHSDIGDGSTTPLDLVRSQLASRLDMTLVSDHDSTDNHALINEYSQKRNITFIPSLEVSPGWGHLNILPMPLGGEIIDPSLNVGDIIAEGHKKNALVIVNHPYTDYGYFNNREIAPGGYDPDFDLIELQPTIDLSTEGNMDRKTLEKAMELWTNSLSGANKIYYLTGGSDTHDVASPTLYSGIIRTFAKVDGELTMDSYIKAVADGNAYVSMGPLFFTKDIEFGNSHALTGDTFTLVLDVYAVNGLDTVAIYDKDSSIDSPLQEKSFEGSTERETVSFELQPKESTWYNIIAKDGNGKVAVSNPIWVEVDEQGDIKVVINGTILSFDVPPVLEANRVLVPFRAIGEAIGAEVDWDGATQTVTLVMEDNKVELKINSTIAKVNGKDTELDVPAKIIKERTLVPIRFVNEALGLEVDWNPELQQVEIIH